MNSNAPKRISRLTAILTQLQAKRIVTASELADKYSVSIRTIYRDIKALEQAGIPILTEEGKGYSVMKGYRIPPIMFTEREALALITAEQLVLAHKDASFIKEFTEATAKIKAVLKHSVKEKANILIDRTIIRLKNSCASSSSYLSSLQLALTEDRLVKIEYKDEANHITNRVIEPFAVYSEGVKWIHFAYCRLRNDFRAFRLDRIRKLHLLNEKFTSHDITFQQFIEKHYTTPDI